MRTKLSQRDHLQDALADLSGWPETDVVQGNSLGVFVCNDDTRDIRNPLGAQKAQRAFSKARKLKCGNLGAVLAQELNLRRTTFPAANFEGERRLWRVKGHRYRAFALPVSARKARRTKPG